MRKKSHRRPNAFSHGDQIYRFFLENPGGLLSLDDMQVKFGFTETQAYNAVRRLSQMGVISKLNVYAMVVDESAFPGVDIDAAHRKVADHAA